ncbi:hypothetical protein ACWGR4_38795 [Embleya sp. NPDC055664]
MRSSTLIVIAASTALATVLITSPTASAEPDPPGCAKGSLCAYGGEDQTGPLVLSTAVDWAGDVLFRSAFNNGTTHAGADHVELTYAVEGGTETDCLDHNPFGHYKGNAGEGVHLVKIVWRGSC